MKLSRRFSMNLKVHKHTAMLLTAVMLFSAVYFSVFTGESADCYAKEYETQETEFDENTVATGEIPVYRLYNPNSGEHFYTIYSAERDNAVKSGWKDEGIGWYAPITSENPVYRLYNPNSRDAGSHHYTISKKERDDLVSVGWKYEGIVFYSGGPVDLFRSYNPNDGGHNYTADYYEYKHINNLGWKGEGTGIYGLNVRTSAGMMYSYKEIGKIDGISFALSSCISYLDGKVEGDFDEGYISENKDGETVYYRVLDAAIYASKDVDPQNIYIKWNGDAGYRDIDGAYNQYIPDMDNPVVYFKNGFCKDDSWVDWNLPRWYAAPYYEHTSQLRYRYMKYNGYDKYLTLSLEYSRDNSQSFDIYYKNKKLYTLKTGIEKEIKCSPTLPYGLKYSEIYQEVLEKTSYNENMSDLNLLSAASYCVCQHNYSCWACMSVANIMKMKGYTAWTLSCSYETEDGRLDNDYSNYYSLGPKGKQGNSLGHRICMVRITNDKYYYLQVMGYNGGFEYPWKPLDTTGEYNGPSVYDRAGDLRDYNTVYDMMKGDYGIDITKYDPFDCNTWY